MSSGRAEETAADTAAKVSAWSTGGASATARPGDAAGGPPAAVGIAQAIPWPAYVIQGGTIPANWQPQPIPMNGIGPDGRPTVHYYAPTYTFIYPIGPPVAAPQPAWVVNRPRAPYPQQPVYSYGPYGPSPYGPSGGPSIAGPGQPSPYAPNSFMPAVAPNPAPPAYPPLASMPPPPVIGSPPALPPTMANSTPAAVPPPPQAWVPFADPAAAAVAAAAPAAPVPPPMAAIAMPVPPSVPVSPAAAVPPAVAAQPVSSGGLAPPQPPASRAANSHLWRVVKVYDGDTVTCLDDMNQQQKVRLAGIDAPEAGQDFGQVSRQALADMVFGKTIEVVDEGRDRYGRWIGRLYTDGIDVNRQMVASGNAWHYAAYSKDSSFAQAQAQAQAQRIGLWSQPNPTPPWDYRKTEKAR